MLLRRISKHVKAQNWFAVAIDFFIVVIGVYIGIQVSNWNDEQRVQSLEASYMSRVADELKSNIEVFEREVAFARESRALLRDFIALIDAGVSSDADLVDHTAAYLSDGVFFAKFGPSHATFDELKSTGNLDIIKDRSLREALIALHAYYDEGVDTVESNIDWVLQTEPAVYLGFDALRFDSRTSALFAEQSSAETAQHIRDNKDLLMRHAALHYWIKDRTLEILETAAQRSASVLERIENTRLL